MPTVMATCFMMDYKVIASHMTLFFYFVFINFFHLRTGIVSFAECSRIIGLPHVCRNNYFLIKCIRLLHWW